MTFLAMLQGLTGVTSPKICVVVMILPSGFDDCVTV